MEYLEETPTEAVASTSNVVEETVEVIEGSAAVEVTEKRVETTEVKKPSSNRANLAKEMKQQSGLAFLLNQMRSGSDKDGNSQKNSSEGTALKRSTTTETLVEAKKQCPEIPKTSYKWLEDNIVGGTSKFDANERLRCIVSDCFSSGTTPNFEFAENCPENNYVRSAKFSPDGQYLISDSEDRRVRIFEMDEDDKSVLKHTKRSGGLVYYTQWCRNSTFFGTSSTGSPIHLWDPASGNKVATFRGMNHLDVLEHAFAFDFNHDGLKCYASYSGCIRRFDFMRPGKQISQLKTYKKREGGQSSMLPSLTCSPAMDGVFAVGSIQNSVGIYADQTNTCTTLIQTEAAAIGMLRYSNDGQRLFVGGNASEDIECYDIRFPNQVWAKYSRPALTNQRIHFDIDADEKFLISGSTDGNINVFDLKSPPSNSLYNNSIEPSIIIQNASRTTVAGLSLHPTKPLLATSHGQRVYPSPKIDGEDWFEAENAHDEYLMLKVPLDNSIKLWNI